MIRILIAHRLSTIKHVKGKQYQVLGVATDSETLEKFVVYQALYNSLELDPNALWIRPKNMFLEKVEVLRFKFIEK